jgi:predicted O-linked N-acetylglucosamine transferase (SPINDLY family)
MAQHARKTFFVPADITLAAEFINQSEIDILVYPEVGMDPVAYFLAFSRLAPVQVSMLGHGDTTGIPTIDFFITSTAEAYVPNGPESRYTEVPVPMRGLGAVFLDAYSGYSELLHHSPRTALLERAKFIEALNLPRPAHLYMVNQPLYKLHPSFDEALSRILLQDKLAYIVILDAVNTSTWQEIYHKRLTAGFSNEVQERVIFFTPVDESDCLRATAASHVVLDPFPASGYLAPLQALGIGVPVVTLPGERMASRFSLSFYEQMGLPDGLGLVTSTVERYVSMALDLAHRPKVRQTIVDQLMRQRGFLFDAQPAVEDWTSFIEKVIQG